MPLGFSNWSLLEPFVPKVVWFDQDVEDASGRVQIEIRLFSVSATQTVSVSAETKTLYGAANWSLLEPNAPKVVWFDQDVEDASGRVQIEIRLLDLSATQAVRVSAETKTPFGKSSWSLLEPDVPKVVWFVQLVEDASPRVQMEIRLLKESAVQRVRVSAEMKMPRGLENWSLPEPDEPKVVWFAQVPALQVPALQKAARLVHATHAAPPIPQALALVAVTQVGPLQHPFAQVDALQTFLGGRLHTPSRHFNPLQQFLVDEQATPRLRHLHRRFCASHRRVQQSVFCVHLVLPQDHSDSGRLPRASAPACPRRAASAAAAPPSSIPSAAANPARREVAAPKSAASRSNRR
jgi:hypothetical protein